MKAILASLLMASLAAADPISVKAKSGLIQKADDSLVEVGSGLFLNDEALNEVKTALDALKSQNAGLILSLESANKKIADCSPSVPGLPTWATILISTGLTVLSMVAGFFAVREATK